MAKDACKEIVESTFVQSQPDLGRTPTCASCAITIMADRRLRPRQYVPRNAACG